MTEPNLQGTSYLQGNSGKMKKYLLALTILLFLNRQSFATWSIILIDPVTKEIGIAGASCTYNCYGIGEIIPGIGAVIVQAMSNRQARAKGIEMILAEARPADIIKDMRRPEFDPERQQYAVVSIKFINEPAVHTGDSTKKYNGALTARGVSVQGNTLANEHELKIIFEAVQQGKKKALGVAEILMLALEAGSNAGGDKRCGEQKASSAFIIVAKPGSKKPYLDLNIFGQGKGGPNAVTLLRKKFEKFKSKHRV